MRLEFCIACPSHTLLPTHSAHRKSAQTLTVCAVCLCLLPLVASEPALSCSVDAPSSSNPCCTLLAGSSVAMKYAVLEQAFLTYTISSTPPAICLEDDPANTVTALHWQAMIDSLTPLFDEQNCWGGQIAKTPGDGIKSLKTRQDYARRLQLVRCDTHFRVDGDWSAWASWSTCQNGNSNSNSTRSRACNNPLPAMGGANCTGLSMEEQLCPPDTVSSSSSSSSSAMHSNAKSSTAMGPTYQGASTGVEEIGAAMATSFSVLVSFALPILARFSF